ncbi:MAG: hypothetical protein LM549_11300, partial [Candidatus Competibacter sp.]|nr:hypothetical protein [Candidatus Competibacter sp.]
TANPPATARTAQKPGRGGKRRPQDRAKRDAAANEENRATATKPDSERRERRNDRPKAEPPHGATCTAPKKSSGC